MNVICPLCRGPAVQPIMDIYCKSECQKGTPVNSSGYKYRYELTGWYYEVWDKPPPPTYSNYSVTWTYPNKDLNWYIKDSLQRMQYSFHYKESSAAQDPKEYKQDWLLVRILK